MFGDSLLPSECSFIVEELKHTSLCFQVRYTFSCLWIYWEERKHFFTKWEFSVQCAHGRPATVPLVNLEALHNQIARLRLMNECSSDECHGLRRHTVRVERAAQRLNSARGIWVFGRSWLLLLTVWRLVWQNSYFTAQSFFCNSVYRIQLVCATVLIWKILDSTISSESYVSVWIW